MGKIISLKKTTIVRPREYDIKRKFCKLILAKEPRRVNKKVCRKLKDPPLQMV